MKGSVFPRPFKTVPAPTAKNPEATRREPIKGVSTWTWQFATVRNGKRRNISKGGYRTKADAQDALTTALAEHQAGARVEPTKLTVREYLEDKWLPVAELSLKPSTSRGYRDIVKNRIVPNIGDVRLLDLDEGDIARMYTTLRTSGRKTKNGGALSEASLQHTHVVLRKALRDAVRGAHGPRLLSRNPADDVARPRRARTEMRVWSAEQLRTFLAGAAEDRWHAAYLVAATTGLRRGELLGLRWEDIELDAANISVKRARVAAGYVVTEGTPKSGRGRTVAIDPETVAVLRRWRKGQLEERMQWGEAWTDSGLVFTCEDGQGVHPQLLSQAFERAVGRAAKASGLPVLPLHCVRHTHATLLFAAGVHPKVVQERLGHASIQITLDTYSHVMPGMQEDAAAKFGVVVFGSPR